MTLRERAGVVAWGLLLFGSGQLLAATVLGKSATAAAAAQAAIAVWGAERAGVAWSDVEAPRPTWGAIGRRVARGAAFGAAAQFAIVAAALALRSAWVAPAPETWMLAFGLLLASLATARDELLLRGIVLRATSGALPTWASLAACGAAAAAARFGAGDGDATVATIAFDALLGVALGALWIRDRGAWMAFAANAAWREVRFASGVANDSTIAALAVAAVAAAAASVWAVRSARRVS